MIWAKNKERERDKSQQGTILCWSLTSYFPYWNSFKLETHFSVCKQLVTCNRRHSLVLCFLINSVLCFLIHGEKDELWIKSQWICIISLPYDIDKLLAEIRLVAGLINKKISEDLHYFYLQWISFLLRLFAVMKEMLLAWYKQLCRPQHIEFQASLSTIYSFCLMQKALGTYISL